MNDDAEIIESRFAELTKRFGDVLEKHEQYVYELEKENTTVEEDGWVEEIVTGYDDLERECCRYIKEQRGKEAKVESHSLGSSGEVLDFEKQRTKQVRELEKSNLMKEINMINDTLRSGKDPEIIRCTVLDAKIDLKAQLERCKTAQANHVAVLSESEVIHELNWVNDLQ